MNVIKVIGSMHFLRAAFPDRLIFNYCKCLESACGMGEEMKLNLMYGEKE